MFTAGIFCLVILLPIVPAYLLFKALPASASVDGLLQGMQIKLGGAFAGYFSILLVILVYNKVLIPPPPPKPPYEVWEVSGRILDENGRPVQPIDATDVELNPRLMDTDQAGVFRLHFYSWPAEDGGQQFPRLSISHKNYQPVPITLDPRIASKIKGLVVSIDGHDIDLHDISLKQITTAYPTNLAPLNTVGAK